MILEPLQERFILMILTTFRMMMMMMKMMSRVKDSKVLKSLRD